VQFEYLFAAVCNADSVYLNPFSVSNNYACIFATIMVVLISRLNEKSRTYSRCELNPE
jgi:hypothetical protein